MGLDRLRLPMGVPRSDRLSDEDTLSSGIFILVWGSLSRMRLNRSTRFGSSFSGMYTLQFSSSEIEFTLDVEYFRTIPGHCGS